MKVSIVTLSFNQRPFLERALNSVLQQEYDDLEYIVVDPGSTDGSRELLEQYRGQLAHLELDPDEGPADGLNRGFAVASGDVFAYVNADDRLLPGAVRKAATILSEAPDLAAVYAHGFIAGPDDRVLRRFRSTPFDARRYVFGGVSVMQQATFVRSPAFREVGGFNARNSTCWDAELILDLSLTGMRTRVADDYWGVFTIHPESISGSGRLEETYRRDCARLFERVMGRAPEGRDRFRFAAARLQRWISDPRIVLWRVADQIGGGQVIP